VCVCVCVCVYSKVSFKRDGVRTHSEFRLFGIGITAANRTVYLMQLHKETDRYLTK